MLERGDENGRWLLHRYRNLIHHYVVNKIFKATTTNPTADISLILSDYADIIRFEYLEYTIQKFASSLQAQGKYSVMSILSIVMNNIHTYLINIEIESAAKSMSLYRPSQPFSKMEKSLGLLAEVLNH